jgi:tryptophan 2,3-dioxygenase
MRLPPISYNEYLEIERLLSCQKLRSPQISKPQHDEMLFVIVHQCYELWFKQILQELDSAIEIMQKNPIGESEMGTLVSRLDRIHQIQKVMDKQIDVLETMTPMDFLEFRDLLIPASGFQSYQFKLIENKMGLDPKTRIVYNNVRYTEHFAPDQKKLLLDSETAPNLFSCLEKWLERTPFLKNQNFDFWKSYRSAVHNMFENEKSMIEQNPLLNEESIKRNLNILNESMDVFKGLFDADLFSDLQIKGHWRMSHGALLAALFIHLYRGRPALPLPYLVLSKLKDIDEALTHWRYRHALMAKRMLGSKVGTGGSSGAKYLRDSTEHHKIFSDFFQLTTFFIPNSALPILPVELEKQLDFYYNRN